MLLILILTWLVYRSAQTIGMRVFPIFIEEVRILKYCNSDAAVQCLKTKLFFFLSSFFTNFLIIIIILIRVEAWKIELLWFFFLMEPAFQQKQQKTSNVKIARDESFLLNRPVQFLDYAALFLVTYFSAFWSFLGFLHMQ